MKKIVMIVSVLALAATAATAGGDCCGAGSSKGAKSPVAAKKTTVAAIKCPVTGEKVASANKAAKTTFKAKTYYFCCPGCKPKFDKNPAKYVKNSAKGKADPAGCGMMGGMGMTGGKRMPQPPAAASPAPATKPASTQLTVQVQAATTKVGSNDVRILIRRGGAAVSGATVALTSAMTSMDMGTDRPVVREVSPGEYHAMVRFSMGGPWRVTATASEGGQTATTALDVNAR